jgi:hypothetical protein
MRESMASLERAVGERLSEEVDRSELYSLDRKILEWGRGHSWADLSRHFLTAAKARLPLSEKPGDFAPTAEILIGFVGAYRKLVVDFLLQRAARNVDAGPYASHLREIGAASIFEALHTEALGSNAPTSDYDMTLAGPAAHLILRNVMDTVAALTRSTTARLFDTNLYIAPALAPAPSRRAYLARAGIPLLEVGSGGGGGSARLAVCVPLPPRGEDFIGAERESILGKLGKDDAALTDEQIRKRYAALAALGERIDAMAYRDDGKGEVDAARFYETLLQMNREGIEGYHGLSTILAVVYGMQGGRMDRVKVSLSRKHFFNAALENAIDLANHWAAARGKVRDDAAMQAKVLAKLAKYGKRAALCLELAAMRAELMSEEEARVLDGSSGAEPERVREVLGLGEEGAEPAGGVLGRILARARAQPPSGLAALAPRQLNQPQGGDARG